MLIKDIVFHYDAGHGWAEVDRVELNQLGISDKITGFSYQKGPKVYLEEDCDLFSYTQAIRAKYGQDTVFNWLEKNDGSSSPIRNYDRYKRDN